MNPAQRLIRTARLTMLALIALLLVSVASAGTASAGGLDRIPGHQHARGDNVKLSSSRCSSAREIAPPTYVFYKRAKAATVRQYIGWCYDGTGSAWMNFSSIYVWQQFHDLGLRYQAQVGVQVSNEGAPAGYQIGDYRQRLVYSLPTRTVTKCTSAWGKIGGPAGETPLAEFIYVC